MGSRLDVYGARPSGVFGNLADLMLMPLASFKRTSAASAVVTRNHGKCNTRPLLLLIGVDKQHLSFSMRQSRHHASHFLPAPVPCTSTNQYRFGFVRSCRLAIRSVLLRKSLGLADAVSGGTSMTREAGHTCHCARATVRTARCARPRHILHGSTRIVTARHGRTKGWLFAIQTLACLFSLWLYSF